MNQAAMDDLTHRVTAALLGSQLDEKKSKAMPDNERRAMFAHMAARHKKPDAGMMKAFKAHEGRTFEQDDSWRTDPYASVNPAAIFRKLMAEDSDGDSDGDDASSPDDNMVQPPPKKHKKGKSKKEQILVLQKLVAEAKKGKVTLVDRVSRLHAMAKGQYGAGCA